MIALDVFLMLLVTVTGAGVALYQTHTMILRLRRNIERLEDQIYELHEKKSELKAVPVSSNLEPRFASTSLKPIVIESLGPPCDPPDSGEPYR